MRALCLDAGYLEDKIRLVGLEAAEADLEEATGLQVNLVELPNARLQDAIEREGVPFAG